MKNKDGFPEHFPIVELACSSIASLFPFAEALAVNLIEDGLKVALVLNDQVVGGASLLRNHRLFEAGTDLFSYENKSLGSICHGTCENELTQLIHRIMPYYDLVLVLGDGKGPGDKIWLLLDDETSSAANTENIMAVFPLSQGKEKILSFLKNNLARVWALTPLWGCILIGGKSSRMGQPKHLLQENDGVTWLERTVGMLQNYTENIVLAGQGEVPEPLHHLTRIPDIPGVAGPITGLLSAMRWQPTHSWLLVACDMPYVRSEGLQWLVEQRSPGNWATLPKQLDDGYTEPLLAHYDFRSAPLYEKLLLNGCLRIGAIGSHQKVVRPVIPSSLRDSWCNVNTPEQLREYRKGDLL